MITATPEAYQLLHQGSLVFSQMESAGIRIDVDYLDRTIRKVTKQVKTLEEELRADPIFAAWRRTYGDRLTLGGREQLARVLFEVMEYPNPASTTTRTGKYRTDDDVLNKIPDCPFVAKYLRWDNLKKKVLGTYLKGIRREVIDGYLHPVFSLHTVATYRSSSSDPNFQNIPVRDPEHGKLIRSCFVPRPGNHLVECDFKGIEVGVSCCYHEDPVLIEYVKDKTKDMHRDMAAQIYKVKPGQVSKMARYCAKNMFVFPQFYGSYFAQCAPNLWEAIQKHKLEANGESLRKHLKQKGIKELGTAEGLAGRSVSGGLATAPGTFMEHIRQIEEDFWGRRFRVYAEWKKGWYDNYLRKGYFLTLTGFKVVFGKGGLLSRNDAVNYPIQGSAFHCLLWTIIRLQKWLRKNRMKTLLVGQIHDSVEADVPPDELQDYLGKVKEIVTVDLPKAWPWIIVPLEVEAEVCDQDASWFYKRPWTEKNGQWGPEEK